MRATSAPTIGGFRHPHQRVAELTQFVTGSPFIHSGCHILGCAADLINAVRKLRCLLSRKHDGVGWNRRTLHESALFIGPLTAGLPAVLPSPPHADIRHLPAAPTARLRARAGLR